MEISEIVALQREYFKSGKTLPVQARIDALKCFYKKIVESEEEIVSALKSDLNKCAADSYMTEIGLALSGIRHLLKNTARYARPKRAHTPIAQFPARSRVFCQPYGNVLVVSPWNYPFLLTVEPLAAALAAGNTVVVKPSAYSPTTSAVIKKLVESCFASEYVCVVEGGREVNTSLLEQKFDYIFFTGSKETGKVVMQKAAVNLTPITLELGGKSPCIVDKTADIKMAAKRIAFGKCLNAGQTCVAPDFVLVDENKKGEFLTWLRIWIREFYGENPLENENYGKIVSQKHFDRLTKLIEKEQVSYGGGYDKQLLKIEPTIIGDADFSSPSMQDEIFGPILPVIEMKDIESAVAEINKRPRPLALYLFTRDKNAKKYVLQNTPFGGGCINDTVIHLATHSMPFGGIGESGMGSYHGKAGFDTFTHFKSVVDKSNLVDLNMRYHPIDEKKESIIRRFLK